MTTPRSVVQRVNLPQHLFLTKGVTKCIVHAPQPAERLRVAKEIHDAWMLLER